MPAPIAKSAAFASGSRQRSFRIVPGVDAIDRRREMNGGLFDFSARGWGRVIFWTVFGTLGCIAVAFYVDSFNFAALDEGARVRAILTDLFVPTVLAVPMLLFLLTKLRELAIAHHDL